MAIKMAATRVNLKVSGKRSNFRGDILGPFRQQGSERFRDEGVDFVGEGEQGK